MLRLAAGDYRLALEPERGGSIASFTWQDEPLMRATGGPSPIDTACFPLVPFANRIAYGRFSSGQHHIRLSPNFPGSDHPHPLHGFGWLLPWTVDRASVERVVLRHDWPSGAWPWPYEAWQDFGLSHDGLEHRLAVTNLGGDAMPAGLGFHPYFPRTAATRYVGHHRGEWQTSADGLPMSLCEKPAALDWWEGGAVGARAVDTVYTGREGPLLVRWPERGIALTIEPSDDLPFTAVYAPADAPFFCVEPVSHATDAFNRPGADFRMLPPGETMTVAVRYRACRTGPTRRG